MIAKAPKPRLLLVQDKDGQVYIRRVAYNVQVETGDCVGEMVYHCDEHVAGPFSSFEKAIQHLRAEKRDPRWPVLAKAAVAAVARRLERFTTDDVWEELAEREAGGGDPRAIGPVMDAAAADGTIERTDETVKSSRKECHGRPVRVWISRVRRK